MKTQLSAAQLAGWRRRVAWVGRALHSEYGTPRLWNPRRPFDDLVYVLLSQKTTLEKARSAYRDLRSAYRPWDSLADASTAELELRLRPLGLWRKRAAQLVEVARTLRERFGRVTLAPLRRLPQAEILSALMALPGVGEKTARCVMLYSFSVPTSPMDVHATRVLSRLGLLPANVTARTAHALVETRLHPASAYALHVCLVAHGRAQCTARSPRCVDCCLVARCRAAAGLIRSRARRLGST